MCVCVWRMQVQECAQIDMYACVCVIYAASLIGVFHGVFIPTCLCLSPLLMVFWWIHGISVLNVVTVQTNA